jgi:hypothetical protein
MATGTATALIFARIALRYLNIPGEPASVTCGHSVAANHIARAAVIWRSFGPAIHSRSRRMGDIQATRWLLRGGVIGPVLFVVGFVIIGALRTDYDLPRACCSASPSCSPTGGSPG